jgi:hypothetical protein
VLEYLKRLPVFVVWTKQGHDRLESDKSDKSGENGQIGQIGQSRESGGNGQVARQELLFHQDNHTTVALVCQAFSRKSSEIF